MAKLTKMDWTELRTRKERAAERAAEVLKTLKVREAAVDPLTIARSEAPLLKVKSGNFRNRFDGQLEYHERQNRFLLLFNDKYDQYVAAGTHHPRTRFTISHELGHYFLEPHHTYLVRDGKSHGSKGEYSSPVMMEREADAFAAALLMPERIMGEWVNDGDPTLENIEEWARVFHTSLSSTAKRSIDLSHFPAAVVPIKDGVTRMYHMSDAMIDGGCYPRPSGSSLPPTAYKAWQAFQSGSAQKSKAQSYVRDWFQTFRSEDQNFLPVFEHYLPIPVTNSMLVVLTVPEDELFPQVDD
jgi:Zn-dependent peptidase ImmA (M78 family)